MKNNVSFDHHEYEYSSPSFFNSAITSIDELRFYTCRWIIISIEIEMIPFDFYYFAKKD